MDKVRKFVGTSALCSLLLWHWPLLSASSPCSTCALRILKRILRCGSRLVWRVWAIVGMLAGSLAFPFRCHLVGRHPRTKQDRTPDQTSVCSRTRSSLSRHRSSDQRTTSFSTSDDLTVYSSRFSTSMRASWSPGSTRAPPLSAALR
jgi:hypothetical protein